LNQKRQAFPFSRKRGVLERGIAEEFAMDSKGIEREVASPGLFYGYVIVFASFLIMIVMWAVYYSFGVFFKPILNEFGWSSAMTSGAFSLSSLISGLLTIFIGVLTDKIGPRKVMSLTGFLLGLGYILMSKVYSAWHIYLYFGVIIGAGMGGSFVPLMTTVARWFEDRRGLMTGIVAAGIGIGAFVGPPVSTRLIGAYGWRISFLILGITVLALVVLSAQLLKRDPAETGAVPYRGEKGGQVGFQGVDEGLSTGQALHTWQAWVLLSMIVCFGYSVFAIMVHIVPHAMELGISSSRAAGILAAIGGVSIIGKVAMGRAVDIIGSRKVFMIGFIIMSATLFWLGSAKLVWGLYIFACFFGFAYGGCVVSESPFVAELFGLRSHGSIMGLVGASFTFGGAIGPFLTGYIFDVTGAYLVGILVCVALCLVGFFLATLLKPVGRKLG
jgi:MFS family permease